MPTETQRLIAERKAAGTFGARRVAVALTPEVVPVEMAEPARVRLPRWLIYGGIILLVGLMFMPRPRRRG